MLCSNSLLLPLPYFRVAAPARVRASVSLPEGGPSLSVRNSGAAYPPEGTKEKLGSGNQGRWTRARAPRLGRMDDRDVDHNKEWSGIFGPFAPLPIPSRSLVADEGKDGGEAKAIFLVSDRTGWTAEQAVDAARGQFERCLVDRLCPMNTHLFSGIDDTNRLTEIIKEAAKEGALLLYDLADPAMAEAARNTCRLWGVPSADVLGPIIEATTSHLGAAPSAATGRKKPLSAGGHGGVAARLSEYVVLVSKPRDVKFDSTEERDAWYGSFIPVDESANAEDFWKSRQVHSFQVMTGFSGALTEEEVDAIKTKEGFIAMLPLDPPGYLVLH